MRTIFIFATLALSDYLMAMLYPEGPMISSILFAALGAGIGAIAGGISKAVEAEHINKRNKAQADAMMKSVRKIDEMVQSGKLDIKTALGRINDMAGEGPGTIRSAMVAAMGAGAQSIQNRYKSAVDGLALQLKNARADASVSEAREIERAEKEVKELAKGFAESDQKVKDSLGSRGVFGGALIGALTRSSEILGKAVNKVKETSSRVISDIGRSLGKVNEAIAFQKGDLAVKSSDEDANFRARMSQGIAKVRLDFEHQKNQVTAQGRQNELALRSQQLGIRNQAEQLIEGRSDVDVGGAFFGGFGTGALGGFSGVATSLAGAGGGNKAGPSVTPGGTPAITDVTKP